MFEVGRKKLIFINDLNPTQRTLALAENDITCKDVSAVTDFVSSGCSFLLKMCVFGIATY